MMLIKSKVGKSRVIDILANNTNSIVYVYDNSLMSLHNSIIVNPKDVSLHVLAKEIQKYMLELINDDKRYDYLIVYTNCDESSVISFYNTIENKDMFPVKDIIITCQ